MSGADQASSAVSNAAARLATECIPSGSSRVPPQARAAPSSKPIDVAFALAGDAALNMDYTLITTSPLVFAAGIDERDITVNIRSDMIVENDEVISVTLQNPTNATVGTPATHELIILDND